MKSDPSGYIWYYGNTVQSSSTSYKQAEKNLVKQITTKLLKKVFHKVADTLGLPSTMSIGIVGQSTLGIFGGTISGCLSTDLDGNVVLQGAGGLGGGFPSISASLFLSFTNADNVYQLEGWSGQGGGSVNVGLSIGAEAIIANSYSGINIMAGIGASPTVGEGHTEVVYTAPSVNLFNTHDLFFEIAWWLSGN